VGVNQDGEIAELGGYFRVAREKKKKKKKKNNQRKKTGLSSRLELIGKQYVKYTRKSTLRASDIGHVV